MPATPIEGAIPLFQLRTGGSFHTREPHIVPATPNVAQRFTEFYCQANGSNINAGSTTDANAIYTSTNGNWSTTTNTFIPTDGTNPVAAGVAQNQFVSVYNDGATTAVYIARINSVTNAANGGIVLDTTAFYGTAPTTSATGRSIKVGGAWLGPNGASVFPFGLSNFLGALLNSNGDHVRVNLKNDQTYTVTTVIAFSSSVGLTLLQGYGSIPGDGGKAILTSNVTANNNFTCSGSDATFIDIIFASTGGSASNHCFDASGSCDEFVRCAFHGARGSGLNNSAGSNALLAIECEAFDCNKSNTANLGGFSTSGSAPIICINSYSHDHTSGANSHGYSNITSGGSIMLINSIADTIIGNGVNWAAGTSTSSILCLNCNFYNIAGDAIKIAAASQGGFCVFTNNNFVNIGGRAINNTTTSQTGILNNNARTGNGAPDLLKSIIDTGTDIMYPLGVTPWNAPNTGDFSTILAAAIGTGRGAFTQTDGTNTGTVSYPDIGAAQAQPTTQSFVVTGTQTLPYGYIGHFYAWKWYFSANTTVTVQSGSLPPGLMLVQATPNVINILGTPTTAGTFDFSLRATSGTSSGTSAFEISVYADPDEGIGGLLGGLRPTC